MPKKAFGVPEQPKAIVSQRVMVALGGAGFGVFVAIVVGLPTVAYRLARRRIVRHRSLA